MTAQQQYAEYSKHIRSAKEANQWGLVTKLTKEREALKPALVATLHVKPQSTAPTTTTLKQQQEPSYIPFNYYCIPGSQQAAVLVDQIYIAWTQHHQFKRTLAPARMQEYRAIIEGVVSNVLYALSVSKAGVFLSREKAFLSSVSRYRPGVFNEKLLTVLDDLHEMGVIEQLLGERWGRDYAKVFGFKGQQPVKHRTRLHTTERLETLRQTYQVTRTTDVLFETSQQEVVILKKDESSALLEYDDTTQTIKYREQMKLINAMLERAGDLLAPECQHVARFDQRQRFLVRKFTYGSLQSGGRLWGGFWMNLKKIERPHVLRVNRERTVELDYQSVMIHLAYIVAGEPAPHSGDLYGISGLSPVSRPGIKKLMGALLFDQSPKRSRFPKGVAEVFTAADRGKGFALVLHLIRQAHPGISHLFGTGVGHYLQHLESRVLVNVLLSCEQTGLTALPIHDCVIVAASQSGAVKDLMELTALKVVGRAIPVSTGGKEVRGDMGLVGATRGLLEAV